MSSSKSLVIPILVVAVILLATISTSSAWFFAMHRYYGHILNELNPGRVLYVRCKCDDDSGSDNYIKVGSEYTWNFKPHKFRSTEWDCLLYPDDQRVAFFPVYYDDMDRRYIDWNHNFFYVATEHGVYIRDPVAHVDSLFRYWDPKELLGAKTNLQLKKRN
ncbi:hypothetical protein LINPERHAP2_LOCUS31675 [Linum perenne]